MKKSIIIILTIVFLIAIANCSLYFYITNKKSEINEKNKVESIDKKITETTPVTAQTEGKRENKIKYNLMSDTQFSLSMIAEIIKLPENIQNVVKQQAESYQNVYSAYTKNNSIILIVQEENTDIIRHGLKEVEISTVDGSVKIIDIDINKNNAETELDTWEYAKIENEKLPSKHTRYKENKTLDFVEIWNYDSDNDIKYEVKDEFGHTLSVIKEIIDNETNLRQEHIFYDNNGNIRLNISASYEGTNLVRFTHYNLENPFISITEYENGLKIKETIYNSDYKVKNIYKSNYINGFRKSIIVFDSNDNEIERYESD